MTTGIVESASSSAGGSLLFYLIIKLIRHFRARVNVKALLINNIEDCHQKIEQFYCEETIFINLKKELIGLHKSDYAGMSPQDQRMKIYPLARQYVKKVRNEFTKKQVVLICENLELIKHLGIRDKNIFSILPAENLQQEIQKKNPELEVQKLKLDIVNHKLNKKNIHLIDTPEQILQKIRDIFNIDLK